MLARTRRFALVLLPVAALVASCSDDADGEPKACEGRCGDIVASIENADFEGDGQELYEVHCAVCHGGQGQGGTGPQLAGIAEKLTPAQHVSVVLNGRGGMPKWESSLDDDQIAAIVNYERTALGK
jgi:cytochrome c oxidase subunit 2